MGWGISLSETGNPKRPVAFPAQQQKLRFAIFRDQPPATRTAPITEYLCDTLDNGLRVISVPMPHHHSAEVMIYIGVGSRYETARKAGVSHFLEHMLFKGTADFPRAWPWNAPLKRLVAQPMQPPTVKPPVSTPASIQTILPQGSPSSPR